MLCAPKYDACEYKRREPEQELLHRVLVEHLETFLDRTRSEDFSLPRYVENERTFRLDMETCVHCGGRMRMVAAITDRASVKKYLDGVGLPSDIPQIAKARPPPQAEFDYEYDYDQANW